MYRCARVEVGRVAVIGAGYWVVIISRRDKNGGGCVPFCRDLADIGYA